MKKLLFDLIPLLLFFAALKFFDIYYATGVAIAASFVQIFWLKATKQPIEAMHWINLGVITVFGGMTLILRDDSFVKWKPTIIYWIFTAGLLLGWWIWKQNYIRKLMEKQMRLPDAIWTKLLYSWAVFFAAMGAINLFVAFSGYFDTDQWATFKVFGSMVLMFAFMVAQSLAISKYVRIENSDKK